MYDTSDSGMVARWENERFFIELMRVVEALRRANSLVSVSVDVDGRDMPLQEFLVGSRILNDQITNIFMDGPGILSRLYKERPDLGVTLGEGIDLMNMFRVYVFSESPRAQEAFFGALGEVKDISSRNYPGGRIGPGRDAALRLRRCLEDVFHNLEITSGIRDHEVYQSLQTAVDDAVEIDNSYRVVRGVWETFLYEGIGRSIARKRLEVVSLNYRVRGHAIAGVKLLNKVGDAYREDNIRKRGGFVGKSSVTVMDMR